MVYEFKFPDVGEGLIEGLLVKWAVKVGETVKKDQTVAQVGTDKAVVDLPSPIAATVLKLYYKEGDVVPVGKPLMQFDDAPTSRPSTPVASLPPQAVQLSASLPASSATSVSSTTANTTAQVASNNALVVTPLPHTSSDILATPQVRVFAAEHHVDLAIVAPNGKHGEITLEDVTAAAHEQIQTHVEHAAQPVGHVHDILATPSVRKLARELGVDLNIVTPTGENGHVTADDVRSAQAPQRQSQILASSQSAAISSSASSPSPSSASMRPSASTPATLAQTGTPVQTAAGPVEIVPMSRLRQVIAQRMIQSRHTVAHVTMTDNANVTALVALREKYKEAAAKQDVKLTYLPFIIKAVAATLKKHPVFNASLDDVKQQIILKKYYNIGFAADTADGLYVPVITNADRQNIYELAGKVTQLAQKAKEKRLSPAESSNGTFTISSVGALGVEAFTPIINYPEVAILGVGRIEDRPEVVDGQIKIQKMVTLSFSFDHRIADGADAARFMQTLIGYLTDPESLLMEAA